MGQNVCVGAIASDDLASLRLIPVRSVGYGSWRDFKPEIGDVLDVNGRADRTAKAPHTEDYLVNRWVASDESN